jgi:DNA adenine methylase
MKRKKEIINTLFGQPDFGKAKPFVKWVGGKGQLLSTIDNALPVNLLRDKMITYVEPFVGGGAVLFHILANAPYVKEAIINDINPDLTTAYRTVRDHVEELIALLSDIQNEYLAITDEEKRKEFYLAMRIRYNTKSLNDVENTALFIFLNRTCFNGLYRVNSKGLFNVPFGRYTNPTICDADTLRIDSHLLQRVEILTGDFEQTFNYASENSLFYLDPPYKPLSQTSSFNSYAKEEFNDAEQIRLKHLCDKLDKANSFWLLSNSDVKSNDPQNEFFDDLYSNYRIERVWASRAVNAKAEKRGKLRELLISNQRPTYKIANYSI